MENIASLESIKIKEICYYLLNKGFSITYFGKPWSNIQSNWVYFNTELNTEVLILKFDTDKTLEIHKNDDRKSGLEKGLVDPITKEGVMGLFIK
ncbi:hypothetical protein [Aquimarina litoralis]|uniref:hypothetical protein n=1 Tax=Aquimarina litoralis TaxID=584605 RepID=UPI001C567A04|nr:hypothetical protein [Aquimarina litoralis]MBW1294758.1 hypothetical protein [Aquimarina litoralis]